MATEAQIAANRLNAQKSTGPRTAAGKAVVSQNAVTHGLLAREGVLRGEDWEEFQWHREMLLEELRPAGALEVILAARIVDLTWRLHRAAQDQNETFGALYDRHTAGLRPGEAELCPGEAGAPEPAEPAQRGAILGRMILEDYSGEAVLERLLRCERRIEGSLFRSLHELRRVHDQQCKADAEAAETLARWRDEDDRARKERAFASWRPADSPARSDGPATSPQSLPPSNFTLEPAAQPQSCQTNPIGSEPDTSQVLCGTAVRNASAPGGLWKTNPMGSASSGTGIPPASPTHGQDAHATGGRDAHATEPPEGGTPNGVGNEICQTNPIDSEPDTSQVLGHTAVMNDSAPKGLRKTNPIRSTPSGTGIPPASPNHGQDAHATHGRDAHSALEPGGDGVNLPADQLSGAWYAPYG